MHAALILLLHLDLNVYKLFASHNLLTSNYIHFHLAGARNCLAFNEQSRSQVEAARDRGAPGGFRILPRRCALGFRIVYEYCSASAHLPLIQIFFVIKYGLCADAIQVSVYRRVVQPSSTIGPIIWASNLLKAQIAKPFSFDHFLYKFTSVSPGVLLGEENIQQKNTYK